MIDVKTLDPSGDTHRVVSHTDSERLAAHARVERDCARDEYGPLPPRLRLLVLTVSVFGSFGRPAHAFFAELSRRTGGAVPPPLLPSATWAAPRLALAASHALYCRVHYGLWPRRRRDAKNQIDVLSARLSRKLHTENKKKG